MKKTVLLLTCMLLPAFVFSQEYSLGWEGEKIIQDAVLMNASNWTINPSNPSAGDSGLLTFDDAVHLHWKFGTGQRAKWVQAYIVLSSPLDLSEKDIFGIDICGLAGKQWVRNVELKFEDGSVHAVFSWENLAHIERWCEKLVILKKQFSNYQSINWTSIRVFSIAVTMNSADITDNQDDSGILSFKNLVAQSSSSFVRADNHEPLTEFDQNELDTIRMHAANAVKNRQKSTGLVTTWLQDGSSWLYGQGMALRVLSEEGEWIDNEPVNDFAEAAEKLAHFMVNHQDSKGFWPRAWNSVTGVPIVYLESDNTVWMGDFPWIPGSLAFYYKKSGDLQVMSALLKARDFLYDMIEENGKLNTMNAVTLQKSEVSNYEGYAAALYCLSELGDTVRFASLLNRVMTSGWDNQLQCWNEGPSSSRPVLLVNAWLGAIAAHHGFADESVQALSLAGKLLYTRGPGDPYGFDGIGPVATWYEGTLSYISSEGPGSNFLFEGIRGHINPDGTVPAYNDNLGSMAGIWAVDWSSLDATSWLYFAASGKSPFAYVNAEPGIFTGLSTKQEINDEEPLVYFNGQYLVIDMENCQEKSLRWFNLYNMNGQLLGSYSLFQGKTCIPFDNFTGKESFFKGIYLAELIGKNRREVKKISYFIP
jgi:hypothetical protein